MAILIGVTDRDLAAVRQTHAPRALYLQNKKFDWIFHPQQFISGERVFAVSFFDLGTAVVRHHAVAFQTPAHRPALQLRI